MLETISQKSLNLLKFLLQTCLKSAAVFCLWGIIFVIHLTIYIFCRDIPIIRLILDFTSFLSVLFLPSILYILLFSIKKASPAIFVNAVLFNMMYLFPYRNDLMEVVGISLLGATIAILIHYLILKGMYKTAFAVMTVVCSFFFVIIEPFGYILE